MNPQKGQHIKVLFRIGTQAEGIVEYWSDAKSILRSLNDNSILIIQKSADDILAIKIMSLPSPKTQPVSKKKYIQEEIRKRELEKEIENTYLQPSNDLRLKRLVDLKKLLIEQDKKIVAEKLKEHSIQEPKAISYGLPGFFHKPKQSSK